MKWLTLPLVFGFAALTGCAIRAGAVTTTSTEERESVAPAAPESARAPAYKGAVAQPSALPQLKVDELLEPEGALRPSAKALALSGQHVRLVGFMAELEHTAPGVLYLTSMPVRCDESGGGTADLPPDAVLVRGARPVPKDRTHVPGPVEAVGVLSVGNREDERGHVSNFQIALDNDGAQSARN